MDPAQRDKLSGDRWGATLQNKPKNTTTNMCRLQENSSTQTQLPSSTISSSETNNRFSVFTLLCRKQLEKGWKQRFTHKVSEVI